MFGDVLNSFAVSQNQTVQSGAIRLFVFWALAVSYFAIIIMITPLLLKEITGPDAAAEWQGTLTSATAASGLVLCSILGYLSDRYGRLLFVRIWIIFFIMSSFALVHAEGTKTLPGLLFARLVPFSVGSALCYAFAADIATDSAEVLKAHAALGATFSGAMLFGNVIAAGLGMFVQRIYVLILGSVFVMSAGYLAFFSLGNITTLHSHHHHQNTKNNTTNNSTRENQHSRSNSLSSPNLMSNNSKLTTTGASIENLTAVDEAAELSDDDLPRGPGVMSPSILSGSQKNFELGGNKELSWCDAFALLRKDPLLRNLVFCYSLFRCANVNFFAVFVLYVDRKFGWKLQDIAVFLCLVGFIGAAMQAFVVRWMNNSLNTLPPLEGGAKVLKLFFILLLSAPVISCCYGAAPSGTWLFIASVPAGVSTILIPLFTSKIASLGKQEGLTGFSLGLVGSLQNFIESFLGIIWGKMLAFAIVHYEPTSLAFGLPYYVNAVLYFIVFLLMVYSHHVHGRHRALWMENEGSIHQLQQQQPSDSSSFGHENNNINDYDHKHEESTSILNSHQHERSTSSLFSNTPTNVPMPKSADVSNKRE